VGLIFLFEQAKNKNGGGGGRRDQSQPWRNSDTRHMMARDDERAMMGTGTGTISHSPNGQLASLEFVLRGEVDLVQQNPVRHHNLLKRLILGVPSLVNLPRVCPGEILIQVGKEMPAVDHRDDPIQIERFPQILIQ